jgi:DNA-binding IclR family transcriptional regulator
VILVTTADKLLSVLTLFSLEQPEWTVEDAAQELGLAVSTAYRYFRSLSRAGLIVAFASGRYVLGPAILQLDRQIRLLDPLISTATPIMKRLARVGPSHGIVLLCRLYRDQVMCVHLESVERPDFAISYERGRPMPIFRGAASKAILANLPSRTVRALHKRFATEMQQSGLGLNWDAVKARLRELREAGTAVTRSELDVGMAGISAPVFGPNARVIGSLSFVVPARVITKRFLVFRGSQLRAASHDIHEGLRLLAVGHAGMKS